MVSSRGLALLWTAAALGAATPVAGVQVSEVQISPAEVALAVGQQQSVFATAYDRAGNVVATAEFTWTSSDVNVVRVEADPSSPGVANMVGVGAGEARVTARAGGATAQAVVQVSGAGGVSVPAGSGTATVLRIEPSNIELLPSETRQLTPLFLRDNGEPASLQTVSWTSLSPTVASVTNAGLVTAVSEGQGVIQVTSSGGLTANAPVSVSRADFGFQRPIISMSPGDEQTMQVVVPSQNDRVLLASALSWRSTNPSVATVSPVGVVRAAGAGAARVIASGYLQEQAVDVRVHRPVSTMELAPGPSAGPVTVPFNGSITFVADALAADGSPVPDAPMIWTIADTAIARFDPGNLQLYGLQLGSTQLHLRGPGPDVLEATWDVNVVAGGLAIVPARRGLRVQDTLHLGAQFTDSAGRAISPASGHTWSTTDESVAQVSVAGVVSAVGRGRAGIVASTQWGAADTADIYVQGELLFASTRGGSVDLWAVDRVTPGHATQVTSHAAVEVSPAFSPDGGRIAFVSTRDGNAELYVANADGTDAARLSDTPGNEDTPAWSPDGSRIYFAYSAPRSRAQVWVMNADGSGRRVLTPDTSATNFQPAVSPDGGTVAFTSTRDGNYEVYLMNADGSNARNLTQDPGKQSLPQWFSSEELGYLAESRSGNAIESTVVRRNVTSGAQAPMSPNSLMVTDFAVSRDGQFLALQVESFGPDGGMSRRLYLLPLGGGGPQEVPRTTAGEQQSGPGWR